MRSGESASITVLLKIEQFPVRIRTSIHKAIRTPRSLRREAVVTRKSPRSLTVVASKGSVRAGGTESVVIASGMTGSVIGEIR